MRDPLLHFLLIGALLFAGFMLLSESDDPATQTIVVSRAQQDQLAASFARVWQRPPTAAELKGLVDDYLREELANREALAMGLGDNDLVIRRRLRQKYEALMEQLAAAVEPTEKDLEDYFSAHADRYRREARVTLQQRFFSTDRRSDAAADATQALETLDATNPALDTALGDSLSIPQRFEDVRLGEVQARLGEAFTVGLDELPLKRWSGPIPSAYGAHLVFIETLIPARLPPLGAVREEVLRDWRDAQLGEAREALYENLRERYEVRIEAVPAENPARAGSGP